MSFLKVEPTTPINNYKPKSYFFPRSLGKAQAFNEKARNTNSAKVNPERKTEVNQKLNNPKGPKIFGRFSSSRSAMRAGGLSLDSAGAADTVAR